MRTLKGPVYQASFMVPHLKVGDHREWVVLFSSRDLFMHLCRHLWVARHLGVLIARVRACMVHNSNLQGEEIIVDFQGPHRSFQVRDFFLFVEIPIT